jgi:peptidyl-prolyl cis-trans isomerase SurA
MDPSLYSQVSSLKDDAISQPILDTDENGKKSYKLITVTNRINEHIADATDYIKIKELALKKSKSKQ